MLYEQIERLITASMDAESNKSHGHVYIMVLKSPNYSHLCGRLNSNNAGYSKSKSFMLRICA